MSQLTESWHRNLSCLTILMAACFWCNLAGAVVYIEEASVRTGYGPTRVGFTMSFSGACGERVGADVSYVGQSPIEEALQSVLQYSRDSVRHLLALCPDVQVIEVSARGGISRPDNSYRFVMRHNQDWAPSELATKRALTDALLAEGYVPALGLRLFPNAAFIRYESGRLDAVYGNNFEGRMSASHIEQIFLQVNGPPQVSHYVVRGEWYEHGSEQTQDQCAVSREGYALWGSFSMTVPLQGQLRVQRKRCAGHDDPAAEEPGMFGDQDQRMYRELGAKPRDLAAELSAEMAAFGEFASVPAQEDYLQARRPLFESDILRIYAQRPDLCSHLDFDAVYRVNSERRDSEFDGDYQLAIGRLLRQLATDNCAGAVTATVDNYDSGSSEPWDRMSFQFERDPPLAFGSDENYLGYSGHFLYPAAEAHAAWLTDNLLGPACTDEPFCELAGGRYLNAIYRGDLRAIRQMDHLHLDALRDASGIERLTSENNLVSALFDAAQTLEGSQLITDITNKYLHSFVAWGQSCLEPGAQVYRFEYTEPVVIETDLNGVQTRSGGDHYETTYTLNPEFFPLRDRIGSARGAPASDSPTLLPARAAIYRGIAAMKHSYDCQSSEVKQFEEQLTELANRVLAEPGTIEPTETNQPPLPEKIMAGPFPPVPAQAQNSSIRIARHAPVALPRVAAPESVVTRSPRVSPETDDGNVAAIDIATMSAAERQQAMTAELGAIQEQLQADMNELNASVLQAIRSATGDERTRLATEYQNRQTELRNRAQADSQAVQAKYR